MKTLAITKNVKEWAKKKTSARNPTTVCHIVMNHRVNEHKRELEYLLQTATAMTSQMATTKAEITRKSFPAKIYYRRLNETTRYTSRTQAPHNNYTVNKRTSFFARSLVVLNVHSFRLEHEFLLFTFFLFANIQEFHTKMHTATHKDAGGIHHAPHTSCKFAFLFGF